MRRLEDYLRRRPALRHARGLRRDLAPAAARARGLRVLMDFVPSHTSERKQSLVSPKRRASRGETRSANWYVWANPEAFPARGRAAETIGSPSSAGGLGPREAPRRGDNGQYLGSTFYLREQPALELAANPAVPRAAMLDVMQLLVRPRGCPTASGSMRWSTFVPDARLRDKPAGPGTGKSADAGSARPPHRAFTRPPAGGLRCGPRGCAPSRAAYEPERLLIGEALRHAPRGDGPITAARGSAVSSLPVQLPADLRRVAGRGRSPPWSDAYEAGAARGRLAELGAEAIPRPPAAKSPGRVGPAQAAGRGDAAAHASRHARRSTRATSSAWSTCRSRRSWRQDPMEEERAPGRGFGRDPVRHAHPLGREPEKPASPRGEPWLPDRRRGARDARKTATPGPLTMLALTRAIIAPLRRAEPALATRRLPDALGPGWGADLRAIVRRAPAGGGAEPQRTPRSPPRRRRAALSCPTHAGERDAGALAASEGRNPRGVRRAAAPVTRRSGARIAGWGS